MPAQAHAPAQAKTQARIAALRESLASLQRVVIAFSGGVDSGLLAWTAHDVLGAERAVAVTAVSPSLARSERTGCHQLAAAWGMRWMEVESDEGSRPGYVANGPDRCYHCKSELMDRLAPIAAAMSTTSRTTGPVKERPESGAPSSRSWRPASPKNWSGGRPASSASPCGTSRPPPAWHPACPMAPPSPWAL